MPPAPSSAAGKRPEGRSISGLIGLLHRSASELPFGPRLPAPRRRWWGRRSPAPRSRSPRRSTTPSPPRPEFRSPGCRPRRALLRSLRPGRSGRRHCPAWSRPVCWLPTDIRVNPAPATVIATPAPTRAVLAWPIATNRPDIGAKIIVISAMGNTARPASSGKKPRHAAPDADGPGPLGRSGENVGDVRHGDRIEHRPTHCLDDSGNDVQQQVRGQAAQQGADGERGQPELERTGTPDPVSGGTEAINSAANVSV